MREIRVDLTGKTFAGSALDVVQLHSSPGTAHPFHRVLVSDPRATLGSLLPGPHIHNPYYDLKRCNQGEEA